MMDGFVNFNKAPGIYWSNKLKCSYLQRLILIHSIVYYEFNNSLITDKQFDCLAKQLVELSKQTKNYNETDYYYVFYDFTGETGFHLFGRLNNYDKKYLKEITKIVLINRR